MYSPLTKKQKLFAFISCTILGTIILLCIGAVFIMQKNAKNASTAFIYQNGTLLERISLSEVTEAYEIRVDGPNGSFNIIEVRPGAIGVTQADCPDQICVKQGFQSSCVLPITCLPHRLVILFSETAEEDTPTDVITY